MRAKMIYIYVDTSRDEELRGKLLFYKLKNRWGAGERVAANSSATIARFAC